ncbi:RluA family pseudouridine synthase [Scatolibacter rhodanostii]|uniref:RluA family pseudouridine synthase n=1 Tax=Scatolibacter rhodanostii TaxID=2014781 RepID=UPI000C088C3B|nr:RluA family pseudouridine synthase [Scatolibacter rhodanostii]
MKNQNENLCSRLEITSDSEKRLDKLLTDKIDNLSRSAVQQLIEGGYVTNRAGKTLAKSAKVLPGELIYVCIPQAQEVDILPENIPLDVVYEDNDLLVVNKPKDMVVHPAPGHATGTLVNALMFHCQSSLSGINGVLRPGIVHRIDKDTSGLLIVAKNDLAHVGLATQIQKHSFSRQYQAIVYGNVKEDAGTISAPIGRHPVDRKKMAVITSSSKARHAATHFDVVKRYDGFTYVKLTLETGRTHQIRVHMAYIGHPVAGDPVYGPKKVITSLNGQCLHAGHIGFVHPRTGEQLTFDAPLPEYFLKFLSKLKER